MNKKSITNQANILPLFGNPVIKKQKIDRMINKYNLDIIKGEVNSNSKDIKLSTIMGLYLKGLKNYNNKLNNYILNFNLQNLIINLKKDQNSYISNDLLNIKISNLFDFLKSYSKLIVKTTPKKGVNNLIMLNNNKINKEFNSLLFNLQSKLLIKKILINQSILVPKKGSLDTNDYFVTIFEKSNLNSKDLKLILKLINQTLYKKVQMNKITDKNYLQVNKLLTLKVIIYCLIILKKLNSKILIKRNEIKLIKYINILYLKKSLLSKKGKELIVKDNSNLNNSWRSSLNRDTKVNTNFLINNNFKAKLTNPFNEDLPTSWKNKSNLIKINYTLNSISKIKEFNPKTYFIPFNNNIIPVTYNNKLAPIINQYIKSMSIFNMKNKGIIFNYSNIISFYFITKKNKISRTSQNIYKFLSAVFYSMSCLISKPIFVVTPKKIIIHLFYYLLIPNLFKFKIRNKNKFKKRTSLYLRKGGQKFSKNSNNFKYKQLSKNQRIKFLNLSTISIINVYTNRFKKMCQILSRFFKKHVELNLIRLHYPYNDSNILVNLLGIIINKIKIRIIIRKLFRKAIIKNPNKFNSANKNTILPAFLSGINIRIAGRLLTQKVVPRQTVKTIRRGSLSKGKVNFLDVGRLTKKNKRGAFSITVSSGHNFK